MFHIYRKKIKLMLIFIKYLLHKMQLYEIKNIYFKMSYFYLCHILC